MQSFSLPKFIANSLCQHVLLCCLSTSPLFRRMVSAHILHLNKIFRTSGLAIGIKHARLPPRFCPPTSHPSLRPLVAIATLDCRQYPILLLFQPTRCCDTGFLAFPRVPQTLSYISSLCSSERSTNGGPVKNIR